ncbi:class I SAM-dependent rRNA methyltransferase [Teredinibacter turnerae]|uniref:class I SAM-dependent rRNA methyltransferase n=1 Tax=Teredinibacter turnerae TaxID=2426 RepID=UPI000AECA5C1|nr:class I SAM-dependent rRNA methyltransferase [Teredinibacter turnerae]
MNEQIAGAIRLKKNEDRRLKAGHLWIYSNEVDVAQTPLKNILPGSQLRVESASGQLLGTAYVNPHSLICARMVTRTDQPLDRSLLVHRIKIALSLRERFFPEPFYRLIYGESDLLPGLVVDRFGEHLCVQTTTAGMELMTDEIIAALDKVLRPSSILLRNDSSAREFENLPEQVVAALGEPPAEVELIENGVRFIAPLHDGQKTGWFYDQRPNRAWLKGLVEGKRVLDVFSYVGAFGVQALAWGAKDLWCADASARALDVAQKNAQLQGGGDRFTALEGDAFASLKALKENDERFDVVIVDPPAFIKRKKDLAAGTQAYRRINELAMRLLDRDGLLLAGSCSMHLPRESLHDILRASGRHLDRHVQVLAEGMQGADHPVHPSIQETRYLKAFLARSVRV